MDKSYRTKITAKHARILRIVYAALNAISAIGIAITLGSLLVRNSREAAILMGCVAIIALSRVDIAMMDVERKGKGPGRR